MLSYKVKKYNYCIKERIKIPIREIKAKIRTTPLKKVEIIETNLNKNININK